MEIIMKTQSEEETICCPKFDPAPWDQKILQWENKKFVKDRVFTLFYMPLNFGRVMKRFGKSLATARAEMPDYLCLSDQTSKWNMDLYLAVNKEIPGTENVTISGKFYCKVYEGPFQETGKWCTNFKSILNSKGYKYGKIYMWYTTCPKCAKKYGENYVVLLAKLD